MSDPQFISETRFTYVDLAYLEDGSDKFKTKTFNLIGWKVQTSHGLVLSPVVLQGSNILAVDDIVEWNRYSIMGLE